ncbi:MAG: hypothetical protein V8S12_06155 [Lachnospiraceae bacterium]
MNHGIRGAEADRDERFVEKFCGRMEFPLTVAHEKVGHMRRIMGYRGKKPGGF